MILSIYKIDKALENFLLAEQVVWVLGKAWQPFWQPLSETETSIFNFIFHKSRMYDYLLYLSTQSNSENALITTKWLHSSWSPKSQMFYKLRERPLEVSHLKLRLIQSITKYKDEINWICWGDEILLSGGHPEKMCKIRTLADDPTQWICHQPSPHTSMILILNTIHYL